MLGEGGRSVQPSDVGTLETAGGYAELDDALGFEPVVLPAALRLRQVAEQFRDRGEVLMRAQDIGATMEHLAQTADIISVEIAGLAGVFARTKEAERQGASCASEWIRHHCMRSNGAAADIKVVGEAFNELPLSRAAVDEGAIGFGHLVLMAKMARYVANSTTAQFDEKDLLDHARHETVGRFFYTCRAMRRVLDPRKAEDEDVTDAMNRELNIYDRDDGWVDIVAHLDATGGAVVKTALKDWAKKLGPDDHRIREQRDAEALIEICQVAMNNADGGNNRPNLSVICTLEALQGLKGAPAAEMGYGLPISGHTLNRLCCDSRVSSILVDGKRIPVAVGHTKRTLTRAERRALQARDVHCRWPNCHRPASVCDGHHVVFFSHNRRTKLDNIVSLCAMHHWRVHEGGWLLGLAQDGTVIVAPPNYARGPTNLAA